MAYTAPKTTCVGHIHLKVSDLDRAIAFYRDVLGFTLKLRYGDGAAFLAAGEYHHHIGLNTWESEGGLPPPPGHSGLYHVAFLYPDRAALVAVMQQVRNAGIPFDGAAHHGVSTAVYLRDPDGHGVELYYDLPQDVWPTDENGDLVFVNDRFDTDAFIAAKGQ